MSIEYALQDADGNELILNDANIDEPVKGSLTYLDDNFNFDNKTVENSALPGAVKLGETRLKSRRISLVYTRAYPSDSDFRTNENNFIKWLQKAVFLVDKTNNSRAAIAPGGISISYDSGGHKLSSNNKMNLELLTPYFEDVTEQLQNESLSADLNELTINNGGYLVTYPKFTFSATVAIDSIQAYVDDTKIGIEIADSLFGLSTYETMILDCKEGSLKVGNLNRLQSIENGTGFFPFPIGSFQFNIVVNAACDVAINWRRRYYI